MFLDELMKNYYITLLTKFNNYSMQQIRNKIYSPHGK